MRLKLWAAVLCLVGLAESMPKNIDQVDSLKETNGNIGKPHSPTDNFDPFLVNNRSETAVGDRKLKDLKDIDLSLRTVATQLLNVTGHEGFVKDGDKKLMTANPTLITSNIKLNENENSTQTSKSPDPVSSSYLTNTEPVATSTTGLIYGRPINSKFSYFGSGHPGEAMALTEEEIEREINLTKVTTIQKTEPTTTGGISTWILLNPPSTTIKNVYETIENSEQTKDVKVEATTKPFVRKEVVNTTLKFEHVNTTQQQVVNVDTKNKNELVKKSNGTVVKTTVVSQTTHKTPLKSNDKKVTKPDSANKSTTVKDSTTVRITEAKEELVTTLKPVTTTKKVTPTTQRIKVKVTTPKVTPTTSKPVNQTNRPKNTFKRVTPKPNANKTEIHFTSKIEKVTLKPVQTVSTEKGAVANEQPIFISKLKGTIYTESKKQQNNTNLKASDLVTVKPKPSSNTKDNAQVRKPVNDSMKNEIKHVKVNAPILKIDKVDKAENQVIKEDFKVDLIPHTTSVTKIAEISTTSSTTKRPRHSSKRKKNKSRRRKPSTVAPAITLNTVEDLITDNINSENSLQESKIEPEAKVTNSTKANKKKPPSHISTQIYNFLSREVVPSFGVMSLVGLGLGLASYFLYPFGGAITRRNYVVEPNYKYNLDEYGGSNGQNEEEVLKKVLEGMTTHDNKYDNNYNRYQTYDELNTEPTKNTNSRYSNTNGYKQRPTENVNYNVNYRNIDYKYADVPIAPKTDEKQRKVDRVIVNGNGHRQFVVGSIPKEYTTKEVPELTTDMNLLEKSTLKFDNNYEFDKNAYVHDVYDPKPNDDAYNQMEISSTVVAVEHGPRALKTRRSVDDNLTVMTNKRESVIQIIPPKNDMEEHEDINNEILDIIDSALPNNMGHETMNKEKLVKHKYQTKRQEDEKQNASTEEHVLLSKKDNMHSTTVSNIEKHTDTNKNTEHDNNVTHPTTLLTTKSDVKVTTSTAKEADETTLHWIHDYNTTTFKTTTQEPPEKFNIFNFMRNVAEVKFRLGLTLLKHASEGFTRYITHVQKRLNGET